MRRFLTAAAAATTLLLAAPAFAQPLGIGSNPQGTLVYRLAATVSKALSESAMMPSRVQPQSGTGTTVPLVNSGELDIAFCNAREFYDSYYGVGSSNKRPNPNIRAMAVLFPIQVGLFVRNDSPIKSVKDLKGKTIVYGFASQEVIRILLDGLLANAGLSVKDMRTVLVPNLVRGVDELIAGRVDIAFFALGQAKVSEAHAAISGGIRFLPVDTSPAAVAAMLKVVQVGYVDTVKPAPNLVGVHQPIAVAHYDYVAFANKDVPVARVKAITRVIAEQRDAMAKSLPLFRRLQPARMYTAKLKVPYHPGSIAYYDEKGIKQVQ
jgi:TRAP transporter TAXI family solute receptor